MPKQIKAIIIAMVALAVLFVGLAFAMNLRQGSESFAGSEVSNPDEYTLDFTYMNDTVGHTIHLESGDSLAVSFEVRSGEIDVTVGIPGKDFIYCGNDIETASFELIASEEGDYDISVCAARASGKLSFAKKAAGK